MKTNILVGGVFHASFLAEALLNLENQFTIYTSAHPKKFGLNYREYDIKFIPLIASIIQKITKINLCNFSEKETLLFDYIASHLMEECDVLYGWATYSLNSAKKVKSKNGKFILERSCPHILFQENIIKQEAEKLKIKYQEKTNAWIERSIGEYELADFIVVPSQYTYNSFIDKGFSPTKILTVELDKKVLIPPEKKWINKKEFVVGMLGGSVLRKGFLYLLEAWKKLSLPNSKLLLKASEYQLRKSPVVSKYLDELNNVEVLPYFNNINDFYSQCDIFCFPSVDDGFGMAVMEAIANSLPVIITDNVGSKDLFKNQDIGFIVEPYNSEQIAEKIDLFYRNRDLIHQKGNNSYQFTLERERNKDDINRYQNKVKKMFELLI